MITWFVGEQPGRKVGDAVEDVSQHVSYSSEITEDRLKEAFLEGYSARRLATLMGCSSLAQFHERYRRTNLMPFPPPRRAQKWDLEEAANNLRIAAAEELRLETVLVLCGSRVFQAFRLPPLQVLGTMVVAPTVTVLRLPHPSGRCRWWNRPENVEKARAALKPYRISEEGR